MSGMESVGNLSRPGVRPLRSTAKARSDQDEGVQRFDIQELRNGGTMNVGSGEDGQGGEKSIREKYRGGSKASQARRNHNSQLSTEEQIEKLGKIRKSAVEYESVFVDQLVKQMRQSPMSKTPGGDTLSDIAEQPFRDFLSQNGGIGLADTIVNQVARQEGLEQTLHQYPGIMGANWRPTIPPSQMKKSAGNLEMATEQVENKAETAPAPAEGKTGNTLKNFLAGAEKMADRSSQTEEKAAQQSVGMMSGEEIAYLYNDAKDGLA
ncbi:hypothetical protein C4J81_05160 [Deltaproteobacteria bacterium Smac51]|nr:hypothetical protein C4J81_05160 [Deltaproteobacteria bacterium Smac51]